MLKQIPSGESSHEREGPALVEGEKGGAFGLSCRRESGSGPGGGGVKGGGELLIASLTGERVVREGGGGHRGRGGLRWRVMVAAGGGGGSWVRLTHQSVVRRFPLHSA
jgi:hypothetical protein